MLDQNLILVYEGEFTQEITKSVLAMAERNMESHGEASSIKRKVFNVMVECLQNICKYAQNLEDERNMVNNAIFMIGKHDSEYFISSGNAIPNEMVENIAGRLEKINALDKQGLKEYHKFVLKNGELNEKGGAGLGFIDMARKSGKSLKFNFEPMNDALTFFSLTTTIPRVAKSKKSIKETEAIK